MSLRASKYLRRRVLKSGRRSLGQVMSIKRMINSRRSRKRLRQGSSWGWRGVRFMVVSSSGRSSLSSLQLSKTFPPNYGQINLLLSTFILVTFCIFLNVSRRFSQLLRWEIQHIFGTTRSLIMIPCRLFGKT